MQAMEQAVRNTPLMAMGLRFQSRGVWNVIRARWFPASETEARIQVRAAIGRRFDLTEW